MGKFQNRIIGSGEEPLDQIQFNPRNWRVHPLNQQNALKGVLEEVGWVQEVIVNKRTGNLIDGHLRCQLAAREGAKTIPVKYVDLSEEEEALILSTLDPIAAMAVTDKQKLDELFAGIESENADVLKMLDDIAEKERLEYAKRDPVDAEPQIDRAAELNEKWQVVTGDLWQIGDHRLLCGDSTKREDVERVMGGEKAQMTVTSPPYGVGKSYETKGISPWYETIRPVIKNISEVSEIVVWQLGDLYSTGTQYIEPTFVYSVNMFSECGKKPIWFRIWKKQGINYGVGAYHLVTNKPAQQYEYITAFGEDNQGVIDNTDFEWIAAFAGSKYKYVKRLSQTERKEWGFAGIWDISTVAKNDVHVAMYPLELPIRCVKMHSSIGDVVLDPFCGSGTTMVACQNLNRKCRAIEISPNYCAVILERMSTAFPELEIKRM